MNAVEQHIFENTYGEMVRLVRMSMFDVQEVIELICDKDKQITALAYLSSAQSKMYAALSIYYGNFNILERPELEKLFAYFEAFAKEILSSYATDHSQQWSMTEFSRFKKTFDNSVCAFENQ